MPIRDHHESGYGPKIETVRTICPILSYNDIYSYREYNNRDALLYSIVCTTL